ncbi:MAG TPA: glycosyl hydrolase [Candidatus Paceibacterota bacterium]|nr:glycosyl hydrolase [Verrucomicrobiota bacterium]HSA12529.1 glycosyl hydrolase [Candidatus Paceibacterota bacterium]
MKPLTIVFTRACYAATFVLISAMTWPLLAPAQTQPAASSLAALEKQFRELPPEARRLTGPLLWLHGDESREHLEMYVGKVAEGGNGCFTTESRPHNDWLGEGWWRDLDICLNAAKRHNLQLWIFDEKWWPSQAVAGKVPPRYAAKRLVAAAIEVEGPRLFESEDYGGHRYVAAIAGQVSADGKIRGDTLFDLASHINKGKLSWQAPAGKWRILKFTHEQAPGLIQVGGSQLSVDGASQDCVDWYLQEVYQPHFEHYKAEFGKTIRGFFYDEPETPGDWGTEVNRVLAEWGVDWTKAYAAYKSELAGEEQVAARYRYLDALAEAWGRTMYGGIAKWCRQHGVTSTGHFMEHSHLYFNREFCAGDMMRLQGHGHMGGIDAVFRQFEMGKRVTRDKPCWQTPKLGSSISHAYGKANDVAMVEIFGARGQDLTYPEMKWWTDHMHVSGINFFIPHSFNPRAPKDTDCPPYFYNNGFEPRWPLYRVFADYTSRLSLMLTGGRHVCPVALLYLGQSAHCGKHILPDQMSESLQDALYDCDWLPYEVFERDTKVNRSALKLREESYRVLIVPPVEVIPYATLAKAREFFDHGGVVLAYDFLPTKSATIGKTAQDIAHLREAIWGQPAPSGAVCKTSPAGGRSYLLPGQPTPGLLQQVLAGDAGVHPTLEVIEGATDNWLHVLHRVKEGRDVFFIANQNHEGEPRRFRFRITAEGIPECWDAMRNEITTVPFSRKGGQVELVLTFEPNESVLLVFQPTPRTLPPRLEPGGIATLRTVAVTRETVPAPPDPLLSLCNSPALALRGCSWTWYPEANRRENAPPGTRYFRRTIDIPAGATIRKATFAGTADNSFTLFINGREAGQGDSSPEGWRNPAELDVTRFLAPGRNQLAIAAVNGGDKPNPAGLLGCLTVELASGPPLTDRVGKTWKTSKENPEHWTEAGFDDSSWPAARELLAFGAGVWGTLNGKLTLSPVKADPFLGHCDFAAADLQRSRVYLELGTIAPEVAARVTVNGSEAGGFIGMPSRLEISKHLKPGANTIRIEPFAPESVRLAVYP